MPQYFRYISFSILLILFTELLIHTVYEKMGYEEIATKNKKKHKKAPSSKKPTKKKLPSKKEKPEKKSSADETKPDSTESDKQKPYPKVDGDKEDIHLENPVGISNTELSDNNYFEALKKNYLPQYTDQLDKGKLRSDIVIRYYKHTADGERVFKLKQLKYYIHERDAVNTDGSSNAIFYGIHVNAEDIKIVAYILIKNGIPLKKILPSHYGSGWKANSIEIGLDELYSNEKDLTFKEVRDFSR